MYIKGGRVSIRVKVVHIRIVGCLGDEFLFELMGTGWVRIEMACVRIGECLDFGRID